MVERRGLLAPTEQAHGLTLGVLLFAGGVRLRLAALGSRLALALGALLALDLLAFLALDFLGLGLRLLRGRADCREDSLGIVEELHALGHAQVGEPEAVADDQRGDIELEMVGNLHWERLDAHFAVDLAEDAALFLAG